mgnify:CR=1 FL=1
MPSDAETVSLHVDLLEHRVRYQAHVRGVQGRVTTRHMDRAKADVAAAFKKVFTEELQKDGGYQVTVKDGEEVPGTLSDDRQHWQSSGVLLPATTYRVTAAMAGSTPSSAATS